MKPLIAALLLAAAPAMFAEAAKKKPKAPTVTLDVKDAEVRDVLRSMQKQCGIKNMLIDPQVQGMGGATFKFTEVPCGVAFRVVFRTYGLAGQMEPSSVVTVGVRK